MARPCSRHTVLLVRSSICASTVGCRRRIYPDAIVGYVQSEEQVDEKQDDLLAEAPLPESTNGPTAPDEQRRYSKFKYFVQVCSLCILRNLNQAKIFLNI